MDTKEFLEVIKSMSVEDKASLIDILQPKTTKKTVKKKTVPKKKVVKKKSNLQIFDEEEASDDPEVKKAEEISEALYKNRKSSNQSKRPITKMVKVQCKNCNKTYTVSPEIAHNFICCLKR